MEQLVHVLILLLGLAADSAAALPSHGESELRPDGVNRTLYWAEPEELNVIAWKIYKSGRPQFESAAYRNTIWRVEGQEPSVHCSALNSCGLTAHIYVVAVKAGWDGKAFIVMDSEPAHVLWKSY